MDEVCGKMLLGHTTDVWVSKTKNRSPYDRRMVCTSILGTQVADLSTTHYTSGFLRLMMVRPDREGDSTVLGVPVLLE